MDLFPTEAEQRLAVQGFVTLWRGDHLTLDERHVDLAAVDALRRRGHIVIGPNDELVGIHGISTQPTRHRLTHPGGQIYTWCAFDVVGIPAALELDAEAHTRCPTCDDEIQVTFAQGRPTADPDLCLWLPDTVSGPCDHVLDDLCAHANLYCNDEHLAAGPHRPPGTSLTVTDTAALGRTTWQDAATALISPDAGQA